MKTTKRILSIILTLAVLSLGMMTLASAAPITNANYTLTLVGMEKPLLGQDWLTFFDNFNGDGVFFENEPDLVGGILGGVLSFIPPIGGWSLGAAVSKMVALDNTDHPGNSGGVATVGGEKVYTITTGGFSFATSAGTAMKVPYRTIFAQTGTTTVTSNHNGIESSSGIVSSGTLIVNGAGTLNFNGGPITGTAREASNGMNVDGLVVNSGIINAAGGVTPNGASVGIRTGAGGLTVNGTAQVKATSHTQVSGPYVTNNSYGIIGELKINGTDGAVVEAWGDNGAITPAYTVPRGYQYWAGTKIDGSDAEMKISDGTDVIGYNVKYAKIVSAPLVAPVISTTSLPEGAGGVAYTTTLETSAGTPKIKWEVTGLPTGLTYNANTGVISGTPSPATAGQDFPVAIRAYNEVPTDATTTLTLSIGREPIAPTIITTALPSGALTAFYNQQLVAEGDAPITWSRVSGALPGGLTLTPAGLITGVPNARGLFTFTVKAANNRGEATQLLTIIIKDIPVEPEIMTSSQLGGTVGVTYNQGLSLAATGTATIVWSVIDGALPPGLALNTATGVIAGVPTLAGTYEFEIQAENSVGAYTKVLTIVIVNPVPPPPTKWVGLFGYNTKYVANFWNWFKFVVLFGWIWMWFC